MTQKKNATPVSIRHFFNTKEKARKKTIDDWSEATNTILMIVPSTTLSSLIFTFLWTIAITGNT